jgi:hypothetical protein
MARMMMMIAELQLRQIIQKGGEEAGGEHSKRESKLRLVLRVRRRWERDSGTRKQSQEGLSALAGGWPTQRHVSTLTVPDSRNNGDNKREETLGRTGTCGVQVWLRPAARECKRSCKAKIACQTVSDAGADF